ncbi:Cdc6/Cdc18 family protein [Natrialbaceae archaeon A-chndr2]
MMTASIIRDSEPLQPWFLPPQFYDRDEQLQHIESAVNQQSVLTNLHLFGPRGAGKTHTVRQVLESLDQISTCIVQCEQQDTQYKVLKQLCQTVTDKNVPDGHHSSDLKRLFEKRSSQLRTVVVLDQVDFLLLNDGSDLLYYLSRIRHRDKISIITISETSPTLKTELDERTYSTLSPDMVLFEPYSTEDLFQILWDRATQAIHSGSVQRKAVTYIASSTENAAYGLQWLKTAAHHADTVVTEDLVRRVRPETDKAYIDQLLSGLTAHHRLIYDAVVELTTDSQEVVHTGEIYETYRQLARSDRMKPLSDRRISDYIKHLELLQVIEADYHYGGEKGKTREISLQFSQNH